MTHIHIYIYTTNIVFTDFTSDTVNVEYCTNTCLLHVHVECGLLSGVYQETCNKSVYKMTMHLRSWNRMSIPALFFALLHADEPGSFIRSPL